jgi:hypothetical protein
MTNDIFRTVRELIQSNKCVLMGNAVNNEGELYDDSVENLTAILAMQDSHNKMLAALEAFELWAGGLANAGEMTPDAWVELDKVHHKACSALNQAQGR